MQNKVGIERSGIVLLYALLILTSILQFIKIILQSVLNYHVAALEGKLIRFRFKFLDIFFTALIVFYDRFIINITWKRGKI